MHKVLRVRGLKILESILGSRVPSGGWVLVLPTHLQTGRHLRRHNRLTLCIVSERDSDGIVGAFGPEGPDRFRQKGGWCLGGHPSTGGVACPFSLFIRRSRFGLVEMMNRTSRPASRYWVQSLLASVPGRSTQSTRVQSQSTARGPAAARRSTGGLPRDRKDGDIVLAMGPLGFDIESLRLHFRSKLLLAQDVDVGYQSKQFPDRCN